MEVQPLHISPRSVFISSFSTHPTPASPQAQLPTAFLVRPAPAAAAGEPAPGPVATPLLIQGRCGLSTSPRALGALLPATGRRQIGGWR